MTRNLELQRDALRVAGCERIVEDMETIAKAYRPDPARPGNADADAVREKLWRKTNKTMGHPLSSSLSH